MFDDFLVYTSGPITGATPGSISYWRKHVSSKLRELSGGRIRTLSPMRGKEFLLNNTIVPRLVDDKRHILTMREAITTRDFNDVRRCDAVLVNLLGATHVSIGTVMEIALAYELRKPVVVVMETGNIHQHPILNTAARVITDSLDEAISFVYELLRHDTM